MTELTITGKVADINRGDIREAENVSLVGRTWIDIDIDGEGIENVKVPGDWFGWVTPGMRVEITVIPES